MQKFFKISKNLTLGKFITEFENSILKRKYLTR